MRISDFLHDIRISDNFDFLISHKNSSYLPKKLVFLCQIRISVFLHHIRIHILLCHIKISVFLSHIRISVFLSHIRICPTYHKKTSLLRPRHCVLAVKNKLDMLQLFCTSRIRIRLRSIR